MIVIETVKSFFGYTSEYGYTDIRKYTTLLEQGWNFASEKISNAGQFAQTNIIPSVVQGWDYASEKASDAGEFAQTNIIPAVVQGWDYTYGKVSDAGHFAYKSAPSVEETQTFLWDNKEWIVGVSATILVIVIARKCLNKKRKTPKPLQQRTVQPLKPEPPKEKTYTSDEKLSVTSKNPIYTKTIEIHAPVQDVAPPNVCMTFCIDASSSMAGGSGREEAVKKGVSAVLNSAIKVIETVKGSFIEVAFITFTTEGKVILEPTIISKSTIENILKAIKYTSSGSTKIEAGLRLATIKALEMAKRNRHAVHSFICLSDGEDSIDNQTLQEIHKSLSSFHAKLYGIGIGKGHKKETMQAIARDGGKYIDTTNGKDTIEGAITEIYDRTIAVFRNLTLRSPSLNAELWLVEGKQPYSSKNNNNEYKFKIGNLGAGQWTSVKVELNLSKLKNFSELFDLKFNLTYKDAQGNRGKMAINWI